MNLTTDEHRALTFIAAVLCLSAAVRVIGLPEPVAAPAGLDLAAHIEAVEEAVAEQEAMERPLEPGETIDPNTASPAELVRLPRIGPALADRIVADREANGRYRTLGDLARVSGVGDRTLEVLEPHLSLRAGSAAGASGRRPFGGGGSGRAGRRSGAEDAGSSRYSRPGDRRSASGSGALDINRATAQELVALPGIGPVLAGRIVAYRDSVGRFDAVADLVAVKGIGPATLARLEPLVVAR